MNLERNETLAESADNQFRLKLAFSGAFLYSYKIWGRCRSTLNWNYIAAEHLDIYKLSTNIRGKSGEKRHVYWGVLDHGG